NRESMSEDGPVWGTISCSHRCKEGTLKPPAVLVAPFQVYLSRPREPAVAFKDGCVTYSGIEPYVENIHFFFKDCAAAPRTGAACPEQFGCVQRKPYVGAVLFE